MRNARENEMIISTISLGLLAARLELSLMDMERRSAPEVDTTVIDRWTEILRQTIDFLSTSTEQVTVGTTHGSSPRFLIRAPYLEPLYDAVPAANRKGLSELTAYLQDTHKSMLQLQQHKMLEVSQQKSLQSFAQSVAEVCVREASKLKQEPHPEWPSKPALAAVKDAGSD